MSGNFPRSGSLLRGRGLSRSNAAFTLVELLVSMTILILLMMVLVSMVNQTGSMWHHANAKIEEFREARDGFEAMTRRLSQATLNTYWDYNDPNNPKSYIRQSELRFISGPSLLDSVTPVVPRPTHSIFFFAPLGFVIPTSTTDTTAANYQGLDNLLNMWGYFVEYNDDTATRPAFVTSAPRKRFRLMELMQPSQSLQLYNLETQGGGNLKYLKPDWFQSCVSTGATPPRPVHVLAENIIALILLPKLTPTDQKKWSYTDASLVPAGGTTPGYYYSSTGYDVTGSSKLKTTSDVHLNPTNQLPPIVQVTMVAIDEGSANRMTDTDVQSLKAEISGLFSDPANLLGDLTGSPTPASGGLSLQDYLSANAGNNQSGNHSSLKPINFRVFTSDVSIRAAKWSSNQKN